MTQVVLLDKMGSDLSVVNSARVSFSKVHTKFQDNDEKLIKYLATHNHWSPFGHCSLQFRIKAPIFVARQLVKHTVGLCWNEISRRYVDSEPEFYKVDKWRGKPINKKQGSSEEDIEWVMEEKNANVVDSLANACLAVSGMGADSDGDAGKDSSDSQIPEDELPLSDASTSS